MTYQEMRDIVQPVLDAREKTLRHDRDLTRSDRRFTKLGRSTAIDRIDTALGRIEQARQILFLQSLRRS